MNVYDSQRMADVLAPLGYRLTETAQGADMVILNTCHIREKAAEKVFSELGRLKRLKPADRAADSPGPLLAVAGCVAQAEGAEILRRAPQVDIVFGPQAYHRLPEMVARAVRQGGGVLETDFPADSKFDHLPAQSESPGPSAFLSVQEGCDKFCTFCVVPYTRGAEFSRPVADVVREAEGLLRAGSREITLLGQNVNAYHGEGPDGRTWGLGRLIRRLAEIDGLARLRYTTSHPRDMDEDLIAAHGEVPALMPYLHLPVQSGADDILQAMNRRHTAADYLKVVEALRQKAPNIALSSDFIVGFPGEGNGEFAATLRLVAEVDYAQAYSFKYSPRPGTPAAAEDEQVPEEIKAERLAMLQDLLNAQQLAFNHRTKGQVLSVLFDRPGRRPDQLVGRSPYMQAVHVAAPAVTAERIMGQILPVRIEEAHANSLAGSVELPLAADPVVSGPRPVDARSFAGQSL